jgi:hypothetical protein
MRYKVKWRAGGQEPLQPELFNSEADAKVRVRQLLDQYGDRATIDIWNEDETWQMVSPAGVADWCEKG